MILQLGSIGLYSSFLEDVPCIVGVVYGDRRIGLDPLAVGFGIGYLVLISKMIVVLGTLAVAS
jgi:hypothetical protein